MRTTRLGPIQLGILNTWDNYSQLSLVTSLEHKLVERPVFSPKSISWGGKAWDSHWNTHLFLGWPNPKVESQLQFSWVIEFLLYYNLTTWVPPLSPFLLRDEISRSNVHSAIKLHFHPVTFHFPFLWWDVLSWWITSSVFLIATLQF